MRSLIDAFRADRATYYRLDQNRNKTMESVSRKYAFFLITSVVGALCLSDDHEAGVNAAISAMSIILGFAFSVLVFFATQDPLAITGDVVRERRLAKDRANQLADELFDNLTYFVYISLFFVGTSCLFLFISNDESVGLVLLDTLLHANLDIELDFLQYFIVKINDFIIFFTKFSLILFGIESVFTFFRTVSRIVFYFNERRKFNK